MMSFFFGASRCGREVKWTYIWAALWDHSRAEKRAEPELRLFDLFPPSPPIHFHHHHNHRAQVIYFTGLTFFRLPSHAISIPLPLTLVKYSLLPSFAVCWLFFFFAALAFIPNRVFPPSSTADTDFWRTSRLHLRVNLKNERQQQHCWDVKILKRRIFRGWNSFKSSFLLSSLRCFFRAVLACAVFLCCCSRVFCVLGVTNGAREEKRTLTTWRRRTWNVASDCNHVRHLILFFFYFKLRSIQIENVMELPTRSIHWALRMWTFFFFLASPNVNEQ